MVQARSLRCRICREHVPTRILVTAQEIVVEPLHLTGVEMQFRRRQVQLLVGSKTAATGRRTACPAAHDGDSVVCNFSHAVTTENGLTLRRRVYPSVDWLRKNTSGRHRRRSRDIVPPRLQPPTIAHLPCTRCHRSSGPRSSRFPRPARAV